MSEGLLTYDDLAKRWQAPSENPVARLYWVKRRCMRLGIKRMDGFGRGKFARFRPATVERAEALAG